MTFGIEIGAGHSVDLFGIQAEAQAGASGYKTTLSQGGLYASARFMDDDLAVTTNRAKPELLPDSNTRSRIGLDECPPSLNTKS